MKDCTYTYINLANGGELPAIAFGMRSSSGRAAGGTLNCPSGPKNLNCGVGISQSLYFETIANDPLAS